MPHPILDTRRGFLKKAGALGAAGLVGTLGARPVHAAGDDPIRVALVGCGGRGSGAIRNCLNVPDNIKVVAVADAFEDKARMAAEALRKDARYAEKVDLPEERVFSGFDAYRNAIDSGIDLVILATSPGFRPIHYKYAVESGKNVFMEKPCCVDAPGFRSLQESNKLAAEKNLKVGVGLQRHHDPNYLDAVKRIQGGDIGKLLYLQAYWNSGGVWIRPKTPEQTEMEYQMRNWYYFTWLSGDHISEQHVHNLDVCNWVMDAHPVEANGMGGRQVRRGPDVGHIYDHHFIEFTYADGTKMFSQCRHIRACFNRVGEVAHGTLGSADCGGKDRPGAKGSRGNRHTNSKDQEHIDLIEAVRKDTPYHEGWYGATSSFTAVLGRMATYSGQRVTWDDAAEKGPAEVPATFTWDTDPPILPDEDGSYEHAVAMPGIYKPY